MQNCTPFRNFSISALSGYCTCHALIWYVYSPNWFTYSDEVINCYYFLFNVYSKSDSSSSLFPVNFLSRTIQLALKAESKVQTINNTQLINNVKIYKPINAIIVQNLSIASTIATKCLDIEIIG